MMGQCDGKIILTNANGMEANVCDIYVFLGPSIMSITGSSCVSTYYMINDDGGMFFIMCLCLLWWALCLYETLCISCHQPNGQNAFTPVCI